MLIQCASPACKNLLCATRPKVSATNHSSGLNFPGKLILACEMRSDAWFVGLHKLTVVTEILEFHVSAAGSYVSVAIESK